MSRTRRADNVGMHMIGTSHQLYRKCPQCGRVKPIYWISKIDFLCYQCMKEIEAHPYVPPLEKEITATPPPQQERSRQPLSQQKTFPSHRREPPPPTSKKALKRFEKSKRGSTYKSYP
jgi:hypothetical protein